MYQVDLVSFHFLHLNKQNLIFTFSLAKGALQVLSGESCPHRFQFQGKSSIMDKDCGVAHEDVIPHGGCCSKS